MLVANTVAGDSRVLKEARSAAERGWEVTVLGIVRKGRKARWQIGDARVRLLTLQSALSRRHHQRRHAPLRSPLAYARPAKGDFQAQLVRARQADLKIRRAEFAVRRGSRPTGPTHELGRAVFFFQRAGLGLRRRWVGLRRRKTEELTSRRIAMVSPLDRFTTAFWQRVLGDRAWRHLDPGLWDWELTFGPEIDRLKPDIIHANDFQMLGIGAHAMLRARAQGRSTKLVWDAHEFLPGMKPWNAHPRWHIARLAFERDHARHADAVVTVSPALAELLAKEHNLPVLPRVVLNAPDIRAAGKCRRSIRVDCGLNDEVPLLVYSGGAAPQRGLDIAIEALPALNDAHVALVVVNVRAPYVVSLLGRAEELGVSDRVHLLGYVSVDEIVPYLASADIGLVPIHHYPNHEIALITKFLEYSQARLPMVVSDVKTMSETVLETGQGEVFIAEDVDSFISAVAKVLSDPQQYRSAYDQPGLLEGWTWESAADVLDQTYEELHPSAGVWPLDPDTLVTPRGGTTES